jgi:hypothetical protein
VRRPRRIIIHSLADARAALQAAHELGVPLELASAVGAGGYAGAMWFKALITAAREDFPAVPVTAVLDCADEPGTTLNALRHGLKRVRFVGGAQTLKRLRDIALQLNAEIETGRPPAALDLLHERDPEGACREYLSAAQTKEQRPPLRAKRSKRD